MNLVIKSDDILRAWDNVVMLKKRFNQVTSVLSHILSVYRFFLWHIDPIGPRLWLAVAAWLRIFVVYTFRTMISHDHGHDTTRKEKNMRTRSQWGGTSRKGEEPSSGAWNKEKSEPTGEKLWWSTHTKPKKKENVKRKRWRGTSTLEKKGMKRAWNWESVKKRSLKVRAAIKALVYLRKKWLVNIRITVIVDRAQKAKKNKLTADAEVCQRGTIFTNAHQKAIMRLESLFGMTQMFCGDVYLIRMYADTRWKQDQQKEYIDWLNRLDHHLRVVY